MKENQEIEEIKNHGIKVIKNCNYPNAQDVILPESIKVTHFHNTTLKNSARNKILLNENAIAYVDLKNNILIFDMQSNSIKKIKTGTEHITSIAPWKQKFILSGDTKGTIKIWDITKDEGEECIKTIENFEDPEGTCITFSHITKNLFALLTHKKLYFCDYSTVYLLHLNTINNPAYEECAPMPEKKCYLIESSGEDETICVDTDGRVFLLDVKTPNTRPSLLFQAVRGLTMLKKTPNGKYLCGFSDGDIKIYDPKKTTIPNFSSKKTYAEFLVQNLLVLPNTKSIACIRSKIISFLNQETGDWTHQIDCSPLVGLSIFFSFCIGNKIHFITDKGYLITCECAEGTKGLRYLFKNLKISKEKNNFKDCMVTFK
jgi:WD40 repeat protein